MDEVAVGRRDTAERAARSVELRLDAVDDPLDAGGRAVDRGEGDHQRVRAALPAGRRDGAGDTLDAVQLVGHDTRIRAVLDEYIERLHHSRADPRGGERVATRDRGAGAREVLQLR